MYTEWRLYTSLNIYYVSDVQYINSTLVTSTAHSELTKDECSLIRDLARGLHNLQSFVGIMDVYLVNLDKISSRAWNVHQKTVG